MCPLVPWSLDRGKRRTPSLPQLKRRHRVPPWGLVLSSVALGNAIFLNYNTLASNIVTLLASTPLWVVTQLICSLGGILSSLIDSLLLPTTILSFSYH